MKMPLRMTLWTLACLLAATLPLAAQDPGASPVTAPPFSDSEVPLGLNLPTADRLEGWDVGIRFTHRFQERARGNGKDAYGLDGGAYSALGLDFGIGAVPGLNAQIYRTADLKTFTVALQERLLDTEHFKAALRVERYDETVKGGLVGAAVQLPLDWHVGGGLVLSAVPTYLSATASARGVTTVGLGARWLFTEHQGVLGEYYPRPSKVDGAFEKGFALGYQYRTFRHRFTLMATNELGSTAVHVLGGDYEHSDTYPGGPQLPGNWVLGFNIVRAF
ncbi:MAG TPA: DUF5777 family beta-barrel protein [Holophagaceae bacterium]|nr:DUF5777 family beta-barrel protein [Holophagaceae bacterium]HJW08220.1 DUF5777 family beta-barrel protein [Holophagaceae bacterium]